MIIHVGKEKKAHIMICFRKHVGALLWRGEKDSFKNYERDHITYGLNFSCMIILKEVIPIPTKKKFSKLKRSTSFGESLDHGSDISTYLLQMLLSF